jgi:hypothetical protein
VRGPRNQTNERLAFGQADTVWAWDGSAPASVTVASGTSCYWLAAAFDAASISFFSSLPDFPKFDLMVVSDALSYSDVFAAVEGAGACLGRAVNPTILSGKEPARRVKDDNAFVTRVLAQPKIWSIGGEHDLRV